MNCRLRFVFIMCRPILDEMIDTQIVASPIPNALMIIANRDVPKMRRNQIPDQEILRKAWFGIQRNNWASPYILRILEHANRARTHKEWIHVSGTSEFYGREREFSSSYTTC